MARRVIWSRRAEKDQEHILRYWKNHNKSSAYSKLLKAKFSEVLNLAGKNPKVGQQYSTGAVRYIIFRDYKVFYSYTKDTINVIAIWDTRRNPEELKVK
jgi:toxin YoeB